MVQGITALSTLYQRYLAPRTSAGRLAVPVRAARSSFAVYKHILGVPTNGKNDSIPAYKLQILDSLIDRIIKMKKDQPQALSFEKLDNQAADEMINKLQNRLSSPATPAPMKSYMQGLSADAGSIINLLA